MNRKRNAPWRRTVAAYEVLRGRPPKPDYGLLIVLPMGALAGGVLLGLGVEMAVNRRAAEGPGSADSGQVTGPRPVPNDAEFERKARILGN